MRSRQPEGQTKLQQHSTHERIARLEGAVEAIGKDVLDLSGLVREQAKLNNEQIRAGNEQVQKLAQSISDVANKQGRHDWRTMAAWSAVLVAVFSPIIAFTIILGGREIDRIDAARAREVLRIEQKIDANSNTGNVIQIREQLRNGEIRINMLRDESARWDKLIGEKVGIDVPQPGYFAPTE